MDVTDIQNRIHKFQKKRASELDINLTLDFVFMHLTEEIGEIASQIINKNNPSFRGYNEQNLKKEIVQALLDLLLLSKLSNIDLPTEIDKKIREMEKRQPGNSASD